MNNRIRIMSTRIVLTCLAIALVVSLLPAFTPTAEAATSFANRSAVIRTARRYLGRPYVFGANGPRYFDCSSFVRYVYRQHGIYLPRTAASQSRYGRAIPKSKLAAGDIVFFRNTYKRGISHVGIYIGSGRFIHAFPRRGVTVDSLYQRYFTVKYAGAKRVLR